MATASFSSQMPFLAIVRSTRHRRIPQSLPARCFCAYAPFSKFLPTFQPTSSPELDAILDTIHSKKLVPNQLSRQQRRLVSDPTKRDYLQTEDVRASIGESEFRLQPHDFGKDNIPTRETFKQALALTRTPEDWAMVWPDLLAGYWSANVNIKTNQYSHFVRMAIKAGQLGVVIRIMNESKRNGLRITAYEVRNLILGGIIAEASKAEWSEAALRKNLTRSGMIVELMERCNDENWKKMTNVATVFAVPLQLSAKLLELLRGRQNGEAAVNTLKNVGTETEATSGEDNTGSAGSSLEAEIEHIENMVRSYLVRLFTALAADEFVAHTTGVDVKGNTLSTGPGRTTARAGSNKKSDPRLPQLQSSQFIVKALQAVKRVVGDDRDQIALINSWIEKHEMIISDFSGEQRTE